MSGYLCHRQAIGKRQRRWDVLFFDTEEEEKEWKNKKAKMEDGIRRFRDQANNTQEPDGLGSV